MSFWKSISRAVYKEYDRRIKRASLVTEYGAQHHAHDDADHAEGVVDEHAGAADTAPHAEEAHEAVAGVADANVEAADEAEIINVPRGTPVAMGQPAAEGTPEEAEEEH
jgi:hypothetical protein